MIRLLLALILSAPLCAQNSYYDVSATHALYHPGQLHLDGMVELQHPFGYVTCDRAHLYSRQKVAIKGRAAVDLADAEGTVIISLRDRGVLQCDTAHLDIEALRADFGSLGGIQRVSYDATRVTDSGHVVPVSLLTDKLSIEMMQTAKDVQARRMHARGRVLLVYDRENRVEADYALYEVDPENGSSSVALRPAEGEQCLVEDAQGNRVFASAIDVALQAQEVRLLDPVGRLHLAEHETGAAEALNFSAKELHWSLQDERLELQREVHVSQNGTGVLRCGGTLTLRYQSGDKQRELTEITSSGGTRLSYQRPSMGDPQELSCTGPLHLDVLGQRVTLEGTAEEQVEFTDRIGRVQADRVVASYVNGEEGLELTHLLLTGSVRMENRQLHSTGALQEYALADEVEYLPREGRMDLRAAPGERVLYFNPETHVSMSAPALRYERSPTASSQAIQGLGDVRFTFEQLELEKLGKAFALTPAEPAPEDETWQIR